MAVALALNYLEEMLAEPTEALTGTLPRRPSAPTRQRCARGEDHCKLIVAKADRLWDALDLALLFGGGVAGEGE